MSACVASGRLLARKPGILNHDLGTKPATNIRSCLEAGFQRINALAVLWT
jgi:hypothetical protein